MSKKIISLLLAIMLTVSMLAVAAVSVSAQTDAQGAYVPSEGTATNRLYFYMPSDWYNDRATTAGIYWWAGTDACSSWPGYNAHKTEVENIYYCDVPDDELIANVIWNNGFDGGEDTSSPDYNKAVQTFNIPLIPYMPGESDKYPDGLLNADGTPKENFNDMIFVVDYTTITVGDYGGRQQYGGDWYYYYGNGEYGLKPTKEAAVADGQLFNTEYQPPKSETQPSTSPNGDATGPAAETTTPVSDSTVTSGNAPGADGTIDPSKELYFTVKATSNYFPNAVAYYDSETKEVTVTYNLKSAKDVLNAQWTLTYDSDILTLSEKNDPNTVAPVFAENGSILTLDIKNKIYGNSSNLGLYDFSSASKPFVSVVFDVNDIADKAPVITTIDLNVEVLTVSKVGDDLLSSESEEATLVKNSVVSTDDAAKAVKVDLDTVLSPASTVIPPTTINVDETTAPAETKPAETKPAETKPEKSTVPKSPATDATSATGSNVSGSSTSDTLAGGNGGNGAVQTGDASMALIILSVLVSATGAMFFARKRIK